MNTQRWLTLGVAVLTIVCITTAGLWIPLLPFGDDEESELAEVEIAATAQAEAGLSEVEPETTPTSLASIEQIISGEVNYLEEVNTEEEVDPVVADLLEALQQESFAIGEDPYIIKVGNFITMDEMRRGEGTASIYQIGETTWVLRLDPFEVTQGSDLHVLLSQSAEPRTSADALLPRFVDLGPLQALTGAQNYPIPEDIDFDRYESVVIYSLSLNIIYSTATLEEVRGQ